MSNTLVLNLNTVLDLSDSQYVSHPMGSWEAVLTVDGYSKTEILSGMENDTNTMRLEMLAITAGLEHIWSRMEGKTRQYRINVYCHARNVLEGGLTAWVTKWKSNGWVTRDGDPVKHQDLWLPLDAVVREIRTAGHYINLRSTPRVVATPVVPPTLPTPAPTPDPVVKETVKQPVANVIPQGLLYMAPDQEQEKKPVEAVKMMAKVRRTRVAKAKA